MWKKNEQFENILNRPTSPDEVIPPAGIDINTETGEIIEVPVLKAVKQLKFNTAPGENGIFPEMHKVDEEILPVMLTRLLNKV